MVKRQARADDANSCRGATPAGQNGSTATRRAILKNAAITGAGLVGLAGVPGVSAQSDDDRVYWARDGYPSVRYQPTVVHDTVYLGASRELWALEAATGRRRWTADTDQTYTSSTVVGETVYLTNNDGENTRILAYDAHQDEDAGFIEPRWETDGFDETFPLLTFVDGVLCVGNDSGVVYGFDAETGDLEWTYDEYPYEIDSPVTGHDGVVYVGAGSQPRGGPIDLDDETINGGVYALEAATGEEIWSTDFADFTDVFWFASAPTVQNGRVYVVASRNGSGGDWKLFAFDADTGDLDWEHEFDNWGHDAPTVAGGLVLSGMVNGVTALDAETGAVEWIRDDLPSTAAVTVVGDTVFAGSQADSSDHGMIHALDLASGESRWTWEKADGHITNTPIVVNGTLFVGTQEGTLYALDAGVDGSSEDSLVRDGTFGHHHTFAGGGEPTMDFAGPDLTDEDGDTSGTGGNGAVGGDDDSSFEGSSDDDSSFEGSSDDGLPGPGIVGALASLGAVGYLLSRRSGGDDGSA